MKNYLKKLVRVLLFISLFHPEVVSADSTYTPTHEIRPDVIFLIDTSGSMEYKTEGFSGEEPGNESDQTTAGIPVCDDNLKIYGKSRWITLLEILTGTFNNYSCKYDPCDPKVCSSTPRTSNPLNPTPFCGATVAQCQSLQNCLTCLNAETCKIGEGNCGNLPVPWTLCANPDREDKTYLMPHIVPCYSSQEGNGIIDLNIDKFKFSVAFSDPFASDKNLCPVGPNQHDCASYKSPNEIQPQNYGIRNFSILLGNKTEYTSRIGGFIPPAASDDYESVVARNNLVQLELLRMIPWEGTPLAPSIRDIHYYFTLDTDINSDPFFNCRSRNVIIISDGMPTLGEDHPPPYQHSWEEAYDLYYETKQKFGKEVNVFVIGYNIPQNSPNYWGIRKTLNNVQFARQCKDAGWPDPLDPLPAHDVSCWMGRQFYKADNPTELAYVITYILNLIESQIQSRTRTVTAEISPVRNPYDLMYLFNSGFGRIPGGTLPSGDKHLGNPTLKQGFLDRSVFKCDLECVTGGMGWESGGICSLQSLSEKLNATQDNNRKIYTVNLTDTSYPIKKIIEFSKNTTELTAAEMGISQTGYLPDLAGGSDNIEEVLVEDPANSGTFVEKQIMVCGKNLVSTPECSVKGAASCPQNREKFRKELIRFIRGYDEDSSNTTCRKDPANNLFKTGAIYHATPVASKDPTEIFLGVPSFVAFQNDIRQSLEQQPVVLYANTSEGMLHAFRIDRPRGANADTYGGVVNDGDAKDGKELFAFIPNYLLKKLPEIMPSFRFILDGEPVFRTVLLYRDDLTVKNPQTEKDYWKSVLVSGYRDGGPGYFALDVTKPYDVVTETPLFNFMWEIDNKNRCYRNDTNVIQCTQPTGCPADSSKCEYYNLAYSYSTPVLGRISYFSAGKKVEKGVAVFGGGRQKDDLKAINPAAGRAVFIVDLKTGEKIKEFNVSNVADPASFVDDFVAKPACYSTDYNNFISFCAIGDRGGRLWAVDMMSQQSNQWAMKLLYDPYKDDAALKRGGVWDAPAITPANDFKSLIVVYGTSNPDYTEDIASDNIVASLKYNIETGLTNMIWLLPLYDNQTHLEGEKMMGFPVIFNNIAYFITHMPGYTTNHKQDEFCKPGKGRMWGVNAVKVQTVSGATKLIPALSNPDSAPAGQESCTAACDEVEVPAIASLDSDDATVCCVDMPNMVPFGISLVQMPSCSGGVSMHTGMPPAGAKLPSMKNIAGGEVRALIQTGAVSAGQKGSKLESKVSAPKVSSIAERLRNAKLQIFSTSWGSIFE